MSSNPKSSESNMQKPLVSVIIPFYNSEKWITETIHSLLRQTLQNIEIICVDDGSTDSSSEIVKSYCKKDSRIKYYRQDHTGTGSARNKGMSLAKGKYLSFLDADDLYDSNMLKAMSDALEKTGAEICMCGAERFDTRTGKCWAYHTIPDEWNSGLHAVADFQSTLFQMSFAAWNKLFLHAFIDKHGLQFQNLYWANDLYFVSCAVALSSYIYVVNEIYIKYRTNTGMSLQDNKSEHPLCAIDAWLAVREQLAQQDTLTLDGRRSLDQQCFDVYFSYFERFVNDPAASQTIYDQLKYKLIPEMQTYDDPYRYFTRRKRLKCWCIERTSLKGLRWACQPVGSGKRFYNKLSYRWINIRLIFAVIFYHTKKESNFTTLEF